MARYSESLPNCEKQINLYQQTIEDLRNNTLAQAYFECLSNFFREGYILRFNGLGGKGDNLTEIESLAHLKNYFKNILGDGQFSI